MEQVTEQICLERRHTIDERFSRDKERIASLEENMEKLSTLSVQLAEILKNQTEELRKYDKRLNSVESNPAKTMSMMKSACISSVVSCIVAYIVSILN